MSYYKIDGTPKLIRFYYPIETLFGRVAKKTSYKAATVIKENKQADFDQYEVSEDEKDLILEFMEDGMLETFDILFHVIASDSVIHNVPIVLPNAEVLVASYMVAGKTYQIKYADVSTDFTLCGAADNEIGTIFVHNGTEVNGTGTVQECIYVSYVDLKDNAKYRLINLDLIDRRILAALVDFVMAKWYALKGLSEDAKNHKLEFRDNLAAISIKSLPLRQV